MTADSIPGGQLDQRVLNGRRRLLDGADEHAATCGSGKNTSATFFPCLRLHRKFARGNVYKGKLRTRSGSVNAASESLDSLLRRGRHQKPGRRSACHVFVLDGEQRHRVASSGSAYAMRR
jgi:hypothetical protein